MEGLFSFLLFAVFFYLMMRFGCGAHMAHGHQHNEHEAADDAGGIDPVCGKSVQANEGYSKVIPEGRFFFCSKDCLDQFERDPKRYITNYPMLVKSAAAHHHTGEHSHQHAHKNTQNNQGE